MSRRVHGRWMYYASYATGMLLILPFALPSLLVPRAWRRRRFAGLPPYETRSVLADARAELSNALAYVFR